MGRGNNFNHKRKGHEPERPKHGGNVSGKHTKDVEFSIEPTAKDGHGPVTIRQE